MKNYKPKSAEWFKKRIGKRIYRDHKPEDCCSKCRSVAKDGLVVRDKQHAWYLFAVDRDFGSEGVYLNYRDEK